MARLIPLQDEGYNYACVIFVRLDEQKVCANFTYFLDELSR